MLFGSFEKNASDGVPELRDAIAANNITIAATRRPVPALIGPNPILLLLQEAISRRCPDVFIEASACGACRIA